MYQNTANRLIRFFTSVTFGIILVLSFCYLFIVRQNLLSSQNLAFREKSTQTIRSLQTMDIITVDWLQNANADGKYYLIITDNDTDYFINQHTKKVFGTLWEELSDYYKKEIAVSQDTEKQPIYLDGVSTYTIFTYTSSERYPCLVCHASIPKSSGTLSLWMIDLQIETYQQFYRIVLIFICLALLTLTFLYFFFRSFIRKLLSPLEKNYEIQKQFVSAASHELRTPLTVILSCVSACQKSDDENRTSFLLTIEREGNRMAELISHLLTLTRMDNQTSIMHMQQTDLTTVVLNAYEAFEPLALQKNQTLQLLLPEEDLQYCFCDETRIAQVLAVLLHNAVSYTPEGGLIQLSLCRSDQQFELCVKDNGPGVPDEEKEKIFERFYRGDQSHSSKEHFGLGLAIAAEIIKMHHGRICVKDAEQGGSMFLVYLPDMI